MIVLYAPNWHLYSRALPASRAVKIPPFQVPVVVYGAWLRSQISPSQTDQKLKRFYDTFSPSPPKKKEQLQSKIHPPLQPFDLHPPKRKLIRFPTLTTLFSNRAYNLHPNRRRSWSKSPRYKGKRPRYKVPDIQSQEADI